MRVLEIKGKGDHSVLAQKFDEANAGRWLKCYSEGDGSRNTVRFIIEAPDDGVRSQYMTLFSSVGMTEITDSYREDSGAVFIDPDAFDD